MWALKGKQPEILSDFSHQKICLIGMVDIRYGNFYYEEVEKFNGDNFESFLKKFIAHNNFSKKVIILLDNAKWHKTEKIKNLLKVMEDKLELLYLPPYSPDLNPIERVWKFIRKSVTHNTYFETLYKLKDTLFGFLDKVKNENKILLSLCAIN